MIGASETTVEGLARVRGPRIFLDCSMTTRSTSQAGLQRVVRNVAQAAAALGPEIGLESRLVVFRDGQWRDVPTALDRVRTIAPTPTAASVDPTRLAAWRRRFDTLGDRLYKIFYPRTLVRGLRSCTINLLGGGEPVPDFRADDILLLLDASWLVSDQPHFRAARRAGTRIGLVVYDLMPIIHSRFMLPKACRQFRRWMRRYVPQMDFFLAISQTVRDEFREWLKREFPARTFHPDLVSWFPMGVQLDLADPQAETRPELRAVFEGPAPTYLKVCTLDPRKNHSFVLDAFERVWERSPETRLCFLGRPGWMADELLKRISQHPRLNKQLFWFRGATDAELTYSYRHATATISASLAEGYGLPIVESLQHGRPTMVSDIPVHREVGGDYCAWFDPRDPQSLAQLVLTHLARGGHLARRPPHEFQPVTWEDATRVLLNECQRLAALAASLAPGSRATASTSCRPANSSSDPAVPPSADPFASQRVA